MTLAVLARVLDLPTAAGMAIYAGSWIAHALEEYARASHMACQMLMVHCVR